MNWYRVAGGRLEFRGRITREPFTEWLETTQGAASVDTAAALLRFRFLARSRATRRLWQDLERLVRTSVARQALEEEIGYFASAVSSLCYAPSLPRSKVALHRLVVVPRAMIAGRSRNGARLRLWHAALSPLPDSVRAFVCEQILIEMDSAIRASEPSAANPVEMRDAWSCVGSDDAYVWVDPLWSGPKWTGHMILYEMPREPLSRAQRKELERAVSNLQKSLEALSRIQRQSIVRTAADGLPA
jgi:hypothetical protein